MVKWCEVHQIRVPRVLAFLQRLLDSKMFLSMLKVNMGPLQWFPAPCITSLWELLNLSQPFWRAKGQGTHSPCSPRAMCGISPFHWCPIRRDNSTMSSTIRGCNISMMLWKDWSQFHICSVLSFMCPQPHNKDFAQSTGSFKSTFKQDNYNNTNTNIS